MRDAHRFDKPPDWAKPEKLATSCTDVAGRLQCCARVASLRKKKLTTPGFHAHRVWRWRDPPPMPSWRKRNSVPPLFFLLETP